MEQKPTISEKTLIEKIFNGIGENGWEIVSSQFRIGGIRNPRASNKTMVEPLIAYLRKKGIEVK